MPIWQKGYYIYELGGTQIQHIDMYLQEQTPVYKKKVMCLISTWLNLNLFHRSGREAFLSLVHTNDWCQSPIVSWSPGLLCFHTVWGKCRCSLGTSTFLGATPSYFLVRSSLPEAMLPIHKQFSQDSWVPPCAHHQMSCPLLTLRQSPLPQVHYYK